MCFLCYFDGHAAKKAIEKIFTPSGGKIDKACLYFVYFDHFHDF